MNISIFGIDPGKEGAIAIRSMRSCVGEIPTETFHHMLLKDMTFQDFRKLWLDHAPKHIFIEKAQAMPRQGVVSMFNYGMGQGKILGWIEALEIPHTLIHPRTWCKEMHAGCTGQDAKTKSAQAVRRLFPTAEIKVNGKTPHKGLIDAYLIMEYGRRNFK